jgi:hypothetical protein
MCGFLVFLLRPILLLIMTIVEFELLVQRLHYMQLIEISNTHATRSGLYLGSYNRNDGTFKFLYKDTHEVEKIAILNVSIKTP